MTEIRFKRKTSTEWLATNVVLASGVPGYERDTGKLKIGDGETTWSDLPYFVPEDGTGPSDVIDGGTV